ncbi:hypothetical protein PMG11_10166 [Penicillium brasilianum]|uniref:TLDc domain-containing protein n=2 Tax=Penicillium brasilianum TaxID=104259 RepID=A0A0F7TYA2_PENBI|nr:hypothetical protein PMG11_10166 [Penicillium brasilianum]
MRNYSAATEVLLSHIKLRLDAEHRAQIVAMGQVATKVPQTEFLPAVQTREELQQRFRWRLSRLFMSETQNEWFQTIFHAFCTESDSAKFWTVSDLGEFMTSTFPSELAFCVAEAAPILHRCLLRLGSFPYHNDPHPTLSLDVLRTGMIILLRLDRDNLLDPEIDEASLVFPDRLSTQQQLLLFQSMTEPQGTFVNPSRSAADDHHVGKALEIITYGNFKRNARFPTAVTQGPKYPPVEHFPSSNSTLTTGSIPVEDFRPLLRLMLLTQLYVAGIDPDNFTSLLSEIEAATDCLLTTFLNGEESSSAVSFTTFSNALRKLVPNVFLGLPRLLGPLHSVKTFPSATPPSSLAEAQEMLKRLFTPSVKPQSPADGLIMNLPVLSQLSMSLPQDFPIEAPEILHASREVDMEHVKSHLTKTSKARILLVSGKTGQVPAIFGVYVPIGCSPASLAKPSVIFQLAPIHRAIHQTGDLVPSKESFVEDSSCLTLALGDATLVLTQGSIKGSLNAQFDDGTSQEVVVDAIEVLSFEGRFVCVNTFR